MKTSLERAKELPIFAFDARYGTKDVDKTDFVGDVDSVPAQDTTDMEKS